MVKVIDVTAQSDRGWDEAVQRAIEEAAGKVTSILEVYVKAFEAVEDQGRIRAYRVEARVKYLAEDEQQGESVSNIYLEGD